MTKGYNSVVHMTERSGVRLLNQSCVSIAGSRESIDGLAASIAHHDNKANKNLPLNTRTEKCVPKEAKNLRWSTRLLF